MVISWLVCSLLLALHGVSFSHGIRFRRSVNTSVALIELPLACSEGWIPFGELCYKLCGKKRIGKLNWEKASEYCRNEYNGNLVTIYSQELQDFLTTFLLLSARAQVWIGLHDRNNESRYEWDDGSPVNYSNWEPTEPSGVRRGEEDCVEIIFRPWKLNGKSGNWNDAGCWSSLQYICQRKKSKQKKIHPDPRFCTGEREGDWKYESSCFHLVSEPKNWTEAEEYCVQNYHGHLATVADFAVDFYLAYVYRNMKQDAWIGIEINPDEEQQKWTSGWFVSYENWKLEEPIGCSALTAEGKWAYIPCRRELPFICEYSTVSPPVLKPGPVGSYCPKQPKGWRDLGGDKCYYFDTTAEVTWAQANFLCMRQGGALASIHSEDEIKVLHNFVRYSVSLKFYEMYIGLYRQYDDEFAWADGSPVDFRNWAPNEDSSQHEQCVEIIRETFLWNDVECGGLRGYFCSIPKIQGNASMKVTSLTPNKAARNIDSSRFSIGAVVGVMFCVLLVAFLMGVVVYNFRLCDRGSDRMKKASGNKLESPSAMDKKTRYRSSELIVKDDDALYENISP